MALASRKASCALGLLIIASTSAWGDSKPLEAGIISRYEPPAADYQIIRGDKLLAARIGARVLEGDVIQVLTDRGKLELNLFDRSDPVRIVQSDGAFVVRTQNPTRPFWSPLLDWASDEIELIFREESGAVGVNLRGRPSLGLTDTLMFRVPQRVAAGKRRLVLGWPSSVTGPVHISITNGAGTTIATGTAAGNVWMSAPLPLEPGRYTLLVVTNHDEVSNRLEAVRPSEMPKLPEGLNDAVPHDLLVTARAAWLASQGKGAYLLESLQELPALGHRFPPASILMRAVLDGTPPTPPRTHLD
jgi:hypothetical protein